MVTPMQQAETLRQQLLDTQKQIQALNDRQAQMRADLLPLEKVVGEQKNVLDAYHTAYQRVDAQRKDFTAYFDTRWRMVEAGLGDRRGMVDEVSVQYDKETSDAQQAAASLDAKARDLETRATEAQATLDQRQREYDAIRELPNQVALKLQALTLLQAQIKTEDDRNNTAGAYFLLREFQREFDSLKVPNENEFSDLLQAAWARLDAAKADADAKKNAAQGARDALAKKQPQADPLGRKRREEILKRIAAFDAA